MFTGRFWTTPRCISAAGVSESYPQMAMNNNEICYVFTRGYESPYTLASNHFSTEISEVFTGTIKQDVIWNEDTYVLGGVWVDGDATLTIHSGTAVYFLPSYSKPRGYMRRAPLSVSGVLLAQGTKTQRITFASSRIAPNPGDWSTIKLRNPNAISILDYCQIENGQGVFIDAASPQIEHCSISNNLGTGLLIQNSSALIKKSIICNNTQSGMLILGVGSPYIYGNEIFNNKHGIEADAMVLVVDNPDIDSNYIHHNDLDGIHSNLMNTIIRRNTIQANGGNGIRYVDCEAEIWGNTITFNENCGIFCNAALIPIPLSPRTNRS